MARPVLVFRWGQPSTPRRFVSLWTRVVKRLSKCVVIGISDQSTLHMTSRLPGSGGKLYFYYSAMNAGKTTTLLQSSFNYHERGMKTLLFTPRIDDRYTVGEITSRIGLSAQAVPFDSSFDFYDFTLPVHHSYACLLGESWYSFIFIFFFLLFLNVFINF